MPSLPKFSLLVALAAVTALFALPAAAEATLVYVKNPMKPAVFAANDNGGAAFKVGPGSSPKVSPDGDVIAYQREGSGGKRDLKLAAANGGGSKTVLPNLQDSLLPHLLARLEADRGAAGPRTRQAQAGPARRHQRHPAAHGRQRLLQRRQLLARRHRARLLAGGDRKIPAAERRLSQRPRSGGKPVQLTNDGISPGPALGPHGKIVFVKQLGAKQRKYGPKNELFLMNPNGTGEKRLTHTKVGQLLLGLFPTAWSANGKRLLAEFGGQDTSYAVTVNPKTGAQKPLDKMGDGERGLRRHRSLQ